MKLSYDPSVDAAYIYLAETIGPGEVESTYLCDPLEVGSQINLDFDASGRLLGIEVMGASRRLPESALSIATLPSEHE